jgi:predicted acyl esterase
MDSTTVGGENQAIVELVMAPVAFGTKEARKRGKSDTSITMRSGARLATQVFEPSKQEHYKEDHQ